MNLGELAEYFIIGVNLLIFFYFAVLNTFYLILFAAAFYASKRMVQRRDIVDLYEVFRSPLTPSISVIIPAYNEAATIVESVKSVLMLHYPQFEVLVVNDGSTDETLALLALRYNLRQITKAVESVVPCEPIRGVYLSPEFENLVVVDKENGGKADALNAAINVSRYDLICVVDADSLIEADALLKVARPFIEEPGLTVAVGGIVRILNGCKVEAGNILEVGLPRNYWANCQIVEYLRAFLGGRMGWSALRSLLIISGAFGVFDRQVAIEIDGYRRDTVGEDMDLVVRMHRHLRRSSREYRMHFVPDPVCWTEAPGSYVPLSRQRDRWQRGLMESLTGSLGMLFNPRYGVIGLLAMPYFFFFEMLGPGIELLGYVAVILALALGYVSYAFFILFLSLAILYGVIVSLIAVYLEGIAYRRYPRIRSLAKLGAYSFIENLGYRQLNSWWRTKAYFTYFIRKKKWGEMERKGYQETPREKAPRRSLRYALILLIVLIAAAAVAVPWWLYRRSEAAKYTTPVQEGSVELVARTNGRGLEIHLEEGWRKFVVRGFNVGTALPGKWFSEFPADEKIYLDWFEKIAATDANTIRVYTLLDPIFYRALAAFNRSGSKKLMLLQEIWPDDDIPDNNLYDPEYTEGYRREIATDIEALLGKADIPERSGRAWGDYDTDVSQYILGLLIGREIVWEEASTTNPLNPGRSGYTGRFVSAEPGANAVETWLAETCDYAAGVAREKGWQVPVSFVSWPTLDPMTHPTESTPGQPKEQEQEDTQVVDPNHIMPGPEGRESLFACYHIYPYYPDFMNREPGYAEYRDGEGVLRYGGYLKQFMSLHPPYPAVVGEFGMSTALGIAHLHPEGFHHGGVSEKEQGRLIARMYRAMLAEGYAGGAVFEWADEWAKRTWVDMDYMIPFERHIYWHNVMDPEQNFGVMAYVPDYQPFNGEETVYFAAGKSEEDPDRGQEIEKVSVDHDEAFLYLAVKLSSSAAGKLVPGSDGDLQLAIGIDTFGKDNGTRVLPVPGLPELPTGAEFLLKMNPFDGGLLLARPDYDRGKTRFMAAPATDGEFVPIQIMVNREQVSPADGTVFPAEYSNESVLTYGDFNPGSSNFSSLAHWYVDGTKDVLYVRLPWLLLNVSDPSSLTVLHDDRADLPEGPAAVRAYLGIDAIGTEKTTGFRFYTALTNGGGLGDFQPRAGGGFKSDVKPYLWEGWDKPRYRERLKQSYPEVQELFESVKKSSRSE